MNFSVLISTYKNDNPAQLREALTSIYDNQMLKPAEIVLVKDGELTDDLNNQIENFGLNAPLRVVALEKNVGLGEALNQGLKVCKHDWIARMDSDDISLPNRFQDQVDFATKNKQYSVIGGLIEEFNDRNLNQRSIRQVPENNEGIYHLLKWRNPINHVTVFFKKEDILKAGGYKTMLYFEDYYLWARLTKMYALFYNLQQPLVKVRVGDDMIGRRTGFSYIKKEFKFYKKIQNEGVISFLGLIKIIVIRLPIRLFPSFLIKFIYNNIIRKSSVK